MKDLEEIVGLLEDWEKVLLKVEQRCEIADVHLAFQKAHSLKGTLALAGFAHASRAVHRMEDRLDTARKSGNCQGLDLDPLFRLIDHLRKSVLGGQDLPEQDELQPAKQKARPADPVNFLEWKSPLSKETLTTIHRSLEEGARLWVLQKTFKTSLDKAAWARLPLFNNLAKVGCLYSLHPDIADWDRSQPEVVVSFLFSSAEEQPALSRLFYDPVLPARLPSRAAQRPLSAENAATPLKILVVEDDALTRMLLTRVLAKNNEVEEAPDGVDAWNRWLQALDRQQPYQVMILDQMIPGLSGQELLVRIRDEESRRGVPPKLSTKIYINTAVDGYEFVKLAFKNQADGYFVKPFSLDKILGTIEQLKQQLRD